MKRKTEEEWNKILTKTFLEEEYLVKHKALNKIAQELNSGIIRIYNKIKEYNLSRKRVSKTLRIDNKDKIERMGFILLEPYQGRHTLIKIKCYCGREFRTEPGKILLNHTKSCGCAVWSKRPKQWKGYESLSGKEFTRCKSGAKRRNIGFLISIKDIWDCYIKQNKKCALTNIELYWDSKTKVGNASIDRIDNNKPYEISNIQILHKDVNMMKRHHSQDYFIYICSLINKNSTQDNFKYHELYHLKN